MINCGTEYNYINKVTTLLLEVIKRRVILMSALIAMMKSVISTCRFMP